MAGFGPNDPMIERNIGYRSSLMQSGVKSYNGYAFPPCLKSQITVVPEYDESGRTTKWLTVAITLEFILTDSSLEAEDTYGMTDAQKNLGMEIEVNRLLKRLCQPCQSLIFTASGFGEFQVNTSSGVQDVDFGPKPQVIEYEMLGGSQAAKVTWLCVTRIPPCPGESNGELVQFNYSTSWDMTNAGIMTRTIEGSAEIPLNRPYQLGNQHASDRVKFPSTQLALIKEKILKAFPRLFSCKRNVSFKIKENRKVISFKITDAEVASVSPFFPGISDIEMSQTLTSSLEDGGFLTWKVVYSGNIEVVSPKAPVTITDAKRIAWVWLGKILVSKRKLFESVVNNAARPKTKPIPDPQSGLLDSLYNEVYSWAPEAEADGYNGGAIVYPIHISITDNMFSNTLSFTIAYQALVTTDLITKATGLFESANRTDINIVSDSWVKFINDTGVDKEKLNVYENSEMIVDLCHPVTSPKGEVEKAHSRTEKYKPEPIMAVHSPTTGKDWIDYKCDFRYIQDHQNVISTKLHDATEETQDSYTEEQMKHINEEMKNFPFTGNFYIPSSGDTGDKRVETKVYSPNPSVCYVEMKGYAIRLNGKINPPNLLGVGEGIGIDPDTGKAIIADPSKGGSLAHQYGEDKVTRSVERTGLRDTDGKEVVRHYCSWTRMYVLDRKPASGKTFTTGLPHRFKQDLS